MSAEVVTTPEARTSVVPALLIVGAVGALVSAYVHWYLYVRGGYRGIAPESVLGLTVSRSFVLQAAAGLVLAEALVVSLRWTALALPSAVAGVLYGAGSLVAFALSRTTGLLGFEETAWTTEAVIALVAEIVIVVALVPVVLRLLAARRAPAPRRG